jgi:hypothetical protein
VEAEVAGAAAASAVAAVVVEALAVLAEGIQAEVALRAAGSGGIWKTNS